MPSKIATGAAGLAALLAVPAVSLAAASTPKFTTDTIVPNESIGGLSLGASPAAARRVFGDSACNSGGCVYSGPAGQAFNVMFASTKAHKAPVVIEIGISSLAGPKAPLDALKASGGIGLGSTAAAVKKTYPHVTGSAKDGGYSIPGPGEHSTTFGLNAGRVTSISMESIHVG